MQPPTLCIVPLLLATLLSQPAESTFCHAAGHQGLQTESIQTEENKKLSLGVYGTCPFEKWKTAGRIQDLNGTCAYGDGLRLWKRTGVNEVFAYGRMQQDRYIMHLAPSFHWVHKQGNETYITIGDITRGKPVAAMDIKMGTRTYLESEAKNQELHEDLYEKAIKMNENELSAEDHKRKAMTKLSYMQFRDRLSSTSKHGFRIEAIKLLNGSCYEDFAQMRSENEITAVLNAFIKCNNTRRQEFVKELKHIRSQLEVSSFFKEHEMIGSSLLFVYYENYTNVRMIDFAKTIKLEGNKTVDHRTRWQMGNQEDGYLTGLDKLIRIFEGGRQLPY